MFDILASQPVAKETIGPLIGGGIGRQKRVATVLGMTLEITFDGSDLLTVVAEVLLGSIEAFFATVIDQQVIPHTERFSITLQLDAEASEPAIDLHPVSLSATVRWPESQTLTDFEKQEETQKFFVLASGQVLGVTCMIDDLESLLKTLLGDEAVGSRMVVIAAAVNSYHRVASKYLCRLSDWRDGSDKVYPAKTRPRVTDLHFPQSSEKEGDTPVRAGGSSKRQSHRAVVVRSIIDVHAWNEARWKAVLYVQAGQEPPWMAFTFENEEAARSIFRRWQERFGNRDVNDDIHISVIRELDGGPLSHYIVLVASKPPDKDAIGELVFSTRSMTMTPDSSVNLDRFLQGYAATGTYFLLPAVFVNGRPKLITELAIAKRGLAVKNESSITGTDIESIAIRPRRPRPS